MDKLLVAASICNESKINKFNRLLPVFGNKIVESGVCQGFKIQEFSGDLNLIVFDGRELKSDGTLRATHRRVFEDFKQLLSECEITDEDFENTKGGMSWEV